MESAAPVHYNKATCEMTRQQCVNVICQLEPTTSNPTTSGEHNTLATSPNRYNIITTVHEESRENTTQPTSTTLGLRTGVNNTSETFGNHVLDTLATTLNQGNLTTAVHEEVHSRDITAQPISTTSQIEARSYNIRHANVTTTTRVSDSAATITCNLGSMTTSDNT